MALMQGRGGRRGFTAVATLVAFLGMAAVVAFGLASSLGAPGSEAGGRGAPASEPTTNRPSTTSATPTPTPIGRSAPVRIDVPAMKLEKKLGRLGLSKDGQTLELPRKPKKPGWYEKSATPGEIGPTVVIGYIEAGPDRPGVFRRLDDLREGNAIYVTRADGLVAAYRVDAIKSYRPAKLPVKKIYGATDHSALRIVTCGGSLKKAKRAANVVVYARLITVARS